MTAEHAAEILIDLRADKAIAMRRRDWTFWESTTPLTAKLVGTAASDALAPVKQLRLVWSSENKYPNIETGNWQIVVVWRVNHGVTVLTAFGSLTLPKYPTILSLGEAVLTQAKSSADQYSLSR